MTGIDAVEDSTCRLKDPPRFDTRPKDGRDSGGLHESVLSPDRRRSDGSARRRSPSVLSGKSPLGCSSEYSADHGLSATVAACRAGVRGVADPFAVPPPGRGPVRPGPTRPSSGGPRRTIRRSSPRARTRRLRFLLAVIRPSSTSRPQLPQQACPSRTDQDSGPRSGVPLQVTAVRRSFLHPGVSHRSRAFIRT